MRQNNELRFIRVSANKQRSAFGQASFFSFVQCLAPERTCCSGASVGFRSGEATAPLTHALVRFARSPCATAFEYVKCRRRFISFLPYKRIDAQKTSTRRALSLPAVNYGHGSRVSAAWRDCANGKGFAGK
jgi:hypothetical protein